MFNFLFLVNATVLEDSDDNETTKKALLAIVIILAIILVLENIILFYKCRDKVIKAEEPTSKISATYKNENAKI